MTDNRDLADRLESMARAFVSSGRAHKSLLEAAAALRDAEAKSEERRQRASEWALRAGEFEAALRATEADRDYWRSLAPKPDRAGGVVSSPSEATPHPGSCRDYIGEGQP